MRFNSFEHRTSFCRNKNKLKGVRIKLDQTKKKYNVLRTKSIADENQNVNYVFPDISCRLKLVFKNGTSDFFKGITLRSRIAGGFQISGGGPKFL